LVTVDAEGKEATWPLPEDVRYIAVAPYIEQTHDCYWHSLTSCQGEQGNQPVHITITDQAGAVLVDQDTTTADNGFVGFWLPKDITGTIRADLGGRTGSIEFSTAPGSPTCLTTLQLQ
jgi:hypothetical protein